MRSNKTVIVYDAPVEVFFEYQFILKTIKDYFDEKGILSLKPNIKNKEQCVLDKLGLYTYRDLIEARQKTVFEIYR